MFVISSCMSYSILTRGLADHNEGITKLTKSDATKLSTKKCITMVSTKSDIQVTDQAIFNHLFQFKSIARKKGGFNPTNPPFASTTDIMKTTRYPLVMKRTQ